MYLPTWGMTPAFLAQRRFGSSRCGGRPPWWSEIVRSKVTQPFVTSSGGSALIKSESIFWSFDIFRWCLSIFERILMIAHWSVKVDQYFEIAAKPLTKFAVTCSWFSSAEWECSFVHLTSHLLWWQSSRNQKRESNLAHTIRDPLDELRLCFSFLSAFISEKDQTHWAIFIMISKHKQFLRTHGIIACVTFDSDPLDTCHKMGRQHNLFMLCQRLRAKFSWTLRLSYPSSCLPKS